MDLYLCFRFCRAGTREVHNKLEKNRRAHLKECFEQLKKQLPQMQDEKKTSNLSILGNACRHVQVSFPPKTKTKNRKKRFEILISTIHFCMETVA